MPRSMSGQNGGMERTGLTTPPGDHGRPEPAEPAGAGEPGGLSRLARQWARAVGATSYTTMNPPQLEAFLLDRAQQLRSALWAEPFEESIGYDVGVELVANNLSAPETLGHTVRLLAGGLAVREPVPGRDAVPAERLHTLLGALATGHSRALRERTLNEQEAIRLASMAARTQAERELRESEARFRHQATHDSLTGLPNRALFTTRLNRLFADRRGRRDRRIALCFLDLDGFKAINDRLGHRTGDQLLHIIGQRLAAQFPAGSHLVARMGGDEFLILADDTGGTDCAIAVAEAAMAVIAAPATVDGHELWVTASVGIVELPLHSTDANELMRRADVTLNWAKDAGRGRWALFDAQRDRDDVARYALASAMPAALDRGEFFLDYQPLVGLGSGKLRGVEALLRWDHPTLGVLGPDRFVGLAEESGLIVRLGSRVLAAACRQAQQWAELGTAAPYVSVNLSVRQIRADGLVEEVARTLDRSGLDPHRLHLEITESVAMGSDEEAIAVLRELTELGVRIAIDDFGTGYSNLVYLRSLPVHTLKLAGAFVDGLRIQAHPDSPDVRIVGALIDLGHALGLTVTAESVETPEQAGWLRDLGCDTGQGWHFGRPGPASSLSGLGT